MSQSKVLDDRSAKSFREFFSERWAGFLRETYRNPEQVAVNFGVRYQTALNWWNGDNAPSGYAVAIAFKDRPDAAGHHLTEREAG